MSLRCESLGCGGGGNGKFNLGTTGGRSCRRPRILGVTVPAEPALSPSCEISLLLCDNAAPRSSQAWPGPYLGAASGPASPNPPAPLGYGPGRSGDLRGRSSCSTGGGGTSAPKEISLSSLLWSIRCSGFGAFTKPTASACGVLGVPVPILLEDLGDGPFGGGLTVPAEPALSSHARGPAAIDPC